MLLKHAVQASQLQNSERGKNLTFDPTETDCGLFRDTALMWLCAMVQFLQAKRFFRLLDFFLPG